LRTYTRQQATTALFVSIFQTSGKTNDQELTMRMRECKNREREREREREKLEDMPSQQHATSVVGMKFFRARAMLTSAGVREQIC
jgi:hypothetical protein